MGSHWSGKASGRRAARGLVVTQPGGRLGWLARRWFPGAATRAYLGWIRLTRRRSARAFIRDFVDSPDPVWFNHVELETVNRCNGSCRFCPVSRGNDSRPFLKMDGGLFRDIVGQLADIGYGGYLGLFSNNEPLLDPRLADFAAVARRRLPHAHLNLSTNGSLLDEDRLRALLPHFDRIVVNNYNDRPLLHDNIRRLRDFCGGREGTRLLAGKTLEICLRGSRDVLTTRAGTAPNRARVRSPLKTPCALPFSQLVVRPDGRVSLCCNDALGRMTLGDLGSQGVSDVWFGPAFAAVRAAMLDKGRAGLPLCRGCDFVKHDV